MKKLIIILTVFFTIPLHAGNIFTDVPEKIDESKKYVFYLHGAIIEQGDSKPTHPRYGLYDYPAILSALVATDIELISEQRKLNTDSLFYAKKLVSQINDLIGLGVIPQNITVVGFSKGAGITVITSSLLQNGKVNFAIMATCGEWYDTRPELKELRLVGNILSIYEETDIAGSCQQLVKRSPSITSFQEVAIQTGKEHGAFYLPRNEWLKPLTAWINQERS